MVKENVLEPSNYVDWRVMKLETHNIVWHMAKEDYDSLHVFAIKESIWC